MSDSDINKLFIDGEDFGEDFVIKAQFKVPVRDFPHPVPAHLFQEARDRYSRHMAELEEGITSILENARTVDKSLVFMVSANGRTDVLIKAGPGGGGKGAAAPKAPKAAGVKAPAPKAPPGQRKEVQRPGSRGGKFYRTKSGKIIYGTQPPPGHDESHEATDEEVAKHVQKQLSPSIFIGHTEETLEAFRDSGVFDEDDVATIEIVRNQLFKPELEDLGIDEKSANAKTMIENVFGEKGHHMALHDWQRRFFVENIVASDPERYNEEEVMEMWDDLNKKYQEAVHDPGVQAALKQRAIDYEQAVNRYNYDIEQSKDDIEPLWEDYLHGENSQDTALAAILAMRDLGVLFIPRKGQTKRRRSRSDTNGSTHLQGTMQPDTEYLNAVTDRGEDVEGDHAMVNIARMNAAQLGAVYIASIMASTRSANGDFDTKDAWNDKLRDVAHPSKAEKAIREQLIKTLNTTPTEVAHALSRLHEIGSVVAASANKFNNGESVGLIKLFDEGSAELKPQDVKKLREELVKEQAARDRALKAQENESFAMASALKGGFWDKPVKKGDGTTIKPQPFTWQAQGMNWMAEAKRGLIGFDPGLGKTATVIGGHARLVDEGKIERTILVVPPSVIGQWPEEIRTYAPGIPPEQILDLSPYSLEERKLMLKSDLARNAQFIILSSGTLTEPKEGISGMDAEDEGMDNEFVEALNELENSMLCVDEVHTGGYKGGAEKLEQASVRHRLMAQLLKDREYAFGMTGTAMPNSVLDTFNLVNLFCPGKIGEREQWEGTVSNTVVDEETGRRTVANPDKLAELRARLRPYVFVKEVDDEDVAPQLKEWLPPPPSQMRHELKPDLRHGENGLSQRDYFMPGGGVDRIVDARIRIIEKRWRKRGKLDEGEEMSPQTEALIRRLLKVHLQRQASISPALIDPTYGVDSPAPKLDLAVNETKEHFNGGWGRQGQPVVVFSALPSAFQLLQRRMRQAGIDTDNHVAVIDQTTSQKDRQYIQSAVNEGKIKILLIGFKSGGAGLNLQKAANHMIYLDNPWTPADKRQSIARVQRLQQKNIVRMTSMSMMGTYDPIIEEKIAAKQVLSDAILGDDNTWEDDAQEKIKALLGGVSPDEYRRKTRKMYTEEHDRNFAEIAASMHSGEDLASILLGDKNLTDVEVNKEARKQLGPHLTAEFDKAKDRKKWREQRAREQLGQRIAGVEALMKVMKQELDKNDPEVKEKLERLKSRLQYLKKVDNTPPTQSVERKDRAEDERPQTVDEKDKKKPKLGIVKKKAKQQAKKKVHA